jgi:hypothetical protein
LANRVAAIERTNFLDSLLEWLANHLWDQPIQPAPSTPVGKTEQPSSASIHANAGVHGLEWHDASVRSAAEEGSASEPSADKMPFPYCEAATALLDAQLVEDSPYAPIWAHLTEKHPEQSWVVIWLQRIEAIKGDTRQETQDELAMQGEIDVLGHDVLVAVDHVWAIDAGPMTTGHPNPNPSESSEQGSGTPHSH